MYSRVRGDPFRTSRPHDRTSAVRFPHRSKCGTAWRVRPWRCVKFQSLVADRHAEPVKKRMKLCKFERFRCKTRQFSPPATVRLQTRPSPRAVLFHKARPRGASAPRSRATTFSFARTMNCRNGLCRFAGRSRRDPRIAAVSHETKQEHFLEAGAHFPPSTDFHSPGAGNGGLPRAAGWTTEPRHDGHGSRRKGDPRLYLLFADARSIFMQSP